MKALVYKGPRQLVYETVEDLHLSHSTDQLVKVIATGICGSDLHAFLGHDCRRKPGLVLGHEIFGEVIEGSLKGKKVCVNPILSCFNCHYCNEGRENICPHRTMLGMNVSGGFAQYTVVPVKNCIVVDDDLDYSKAALAEPLATAYHAVDLIKTTNFKTLNNSKALVIGAGSIGILCTMMLQLANCNDITIIDKNEQRLSYLKSFQAVNAKTAVPLKKDFDIVIDAVGIKATRTLALQVIHTGGVIMHVGLGDNHEGLDIRQITLEELSFLGTYAYRFGDFKQAVSLLQDHFKSQDFTWIKTLDLSKGQQAFEDLLSGQCHFAKLMLKPSHL